MSGRSMENRCGHLRSEVFPPLREGVCCTRSLSQLESTESLLLEEVGELRLEADELVLRQNETLG